MALPSPTAAADTADGDWLGRRVEVLVEIAAWSHVKTRADGKVDFISPLPCPWAYGCLPEHAGGDGDPLDAVLLTQRGVRGQRIASRVQGVVAFVDAGARDDKLICAPTPPTPAARAAVVAFFRAYALAKRALNWRRGAPGPTRVRGVRWRM